MPLRAVVLAAVLVLAPLGARAADLVVWWERGYYPQEDEAVREIIAASEQRTGEQVELIFQQQEELPRKFVTALAAGRPPDFAFGILLQDYIGQWAFGDRLVNLSDAMGHFSNLFDPDALDWVVWPITRRLWPPIKKDHRHYATTSSGRAQVSASIIRAIDSAARRPVSAAPFMKP